MFFEYKKIISTLRILLDVYPNCCWMLRKKNGERSSFKIGLKHVPVIGVIVVEANIIEMVFSFS